MSLLALLKMSLILSALLSAYGIMAFEFNSMAIEPSSQSQSLRDLPKMSNNYQEYIQYIYSLGQPYRENINRKIFAESNDFVNNNHEYRKRNGDLINSLLGLPLDMMEAGR